MPRPKTISDAALLDAALELVHRDGPSGLTFATLAEQVSLSPSTVVQRFGTKDHLLRAALIHAWDALDAATERAIRSAPVGSGGVIDMVVALTAQYDANDYADQLMVLREDLRDPVLRARGETWITTLSAAIDERLGGGSGAAGLGELVVAHWQGTVTVWSFTRRGPLPSVVRESLELLLARILRPRGGGRAKPARRSARG